MQLILLTGSKETRADFRSILTTYLDTTNQEYIYSGTRENLSVLLHERRHGRWPIGIACVEDSIHAVSDFKRHFPDMKFVCTEFSSPSAALYCAKTL